MEMPKKPIRRYRRFAGWDYARGASLFITIATAPRRDLFGRVEGDRVRLSPLGLRVWEALEAMPAYNPGVSLFGHVVMPDHVHFNLHLAAGLDEPLRVLGKAIARFKNQTLREARRLAEHSSAISTRAGGLTEHSSAISTPMGCPSGSGVAVRAHRSGDGQAVPGLSWQQGYHDRLCLTRGFIDATERYIRYNPLKWSLMHGEAHALRIVEPLDSPRLDPGDYWKGVGNVALLGPEVKIAALRVSRQIRTPDQIAAVVARLERAVSMGFVILSGFISPGEKAVRDMLCRRADARFIRILPSCIPNARFKPESCYVPAFAAGRYLEIARGNDEVAFGRAACLDYNEEIARIAQAGPGVVAYLK